jgi:hypothetical protein
MGRQPHTFDKDQPSELPGGRPDPDSDDARPSFDEGNPRPSPIERTGDDGVRQPVPPPPREKEQTGGGKASTDATTPPGEGRDPKRHTL